MFVSPFFALVVAFAQWPVWTHQGFSELRDWQVNQVALDNAAIRVGQSERAYRKWADAIAGRIRRLERGHHLWHRCARVPQTAAKCRPMDQLYELRLRTWIGRWKLGHGSRWEAGTWRATEEGDRLSRGIEVLRPGSPPLRLGRCGQCGLSTHLVTVRPHPWRSEVGLPGHPFGVQVETGRGNYRLKTKER